MMKLTRRNFLIATGWAAGGITVVGVLSRSLPILPHGDLPTDVEGLTWVQMLPNGKVRFLCPRAEMGQGISNGLTQVVAAELNIRPEQIDCVLPSTSQFAPVKPSVGSESMSDFFLPTAYGAASLREALRQKAADKYKLALDEISLPDDANGEFVTDSGTSIRFSDLVDEETLILESSAKPVPDVAQLAPARRSLKTNRNLPWDRSDVLDMVQGRTKYSRDVQVAGMLYGKVIKPPKFNQKLDYADFSALESNHSVVKVFSDESSNRIGVICDSSFALDAAVRAVTVVWKQRKEYQQEDLDEVMDVDAYREEDDFEHTLVESGSVEDPLGGDAKQVVKRYRTAMAAHAAIEPRSAIVHYTKDKTEVWGASQSIHFVRERIAKITAQEPDQVDVHGHRLGGAFGGRIICQAAEEAAFLSKVVGKPVRVQWSREEEFQYNHVQPQFDHHIRAAVNPEGKIVQWEQHFTTSPIIFTSAVLPKLFQFLADFGQEDGSPRGAKPPYDIPSIRIRYSDIRTPLVTSAWRGLGAAPNCFARECMLDELANQVGIDPVELRLRNLNDEQERFAEVIRAVAELSGWGREMKPDYGLGVAAAIYKKTPVAVVTEVYVNPANNKIEVKGAWCAQDCGLIVNPDRVEAQVQANVVWGISFALKERLVVRDGAYEATNFDKYQVARIRDAPDVKVRMIEPEGKPPVGVGEPAIAPTPAAIANAIYAATGEMPARLPIRLT